MQKLEQKLGGSSNAISRLSAAEAVRLQGCGVCVVLAIVAHPRIASQDGEAVQPPLKDHYCEKEEAETKELPGERSIRPKTAQAALTWTQAKSTML